jgi:hypothetical protein
MVKVEFDATVTVPLIVINPFVGDLFEWTFKREMNDKGQSKNKKKNETNECTKKKKKRTHQRNRTRTRFVKQKSSYDVVY